MGRSGDSVVWRWVEAKVAVAVAVDHRKRGCAEAAATTTQSKLPTTCHGWLSLPMLTRGKCHDRCRCCDALHGAASRRSSYGQH